MLRPTFLLILTMQLSGCVMWQGQRVPNLVQTTKEPATAPAAIKVVLGHQHKMERDRREWAEGLSNSVFVKGYDNAVKTSPVMKYASQSPTAPVSYVLFLDTAINEHGEAMAIISGLSLMLIPAVADSDIIVTGTLYEAATGKEVGVYDAKGKIETLIWLPLLPVTPFALFAAPGQKTYDDTFTDVFIQLANQLQNQPVPEAVDPARLEIERVPEHIKREIRVL